MKSVIVTAGEAFTDIDAFACAVAYAELLRLQGRNAVAVLPGSLNHSVTPLLRSWNAPFSTKPPFAEYESVLVDISELSHVAKCAPLETIVEVWDHRYGFEDTWKERLGENAHIDMVGACTTLIWEEWKKRGFADKISKTSANLLLIGTVSNTLDFGAQVTTPRDVQAAKELETHANLPRNWKERYFEDQETTILANPVEAIRGDTKEISRIPSLDYPVVMGQLELWDSNRFIREQSDKIRIALSSFGAKDWFLSMPCIKERRNYLYTESERTRELLSRIIGAVWNGNIGTTDKLWLRKEVRKRLLELGG